MPLTQRKEYILACLRNVRPSSNLDEEAAWISIRSAFDNLGPRPKRKSDQKDWADRYVFRLGVIYSHYTEAMPGFTNCDTETRFERFARSVMVDDGIEISRNLVKAAIRRLNARQNVQFMNCLAELNNESVAA